ncbi:MAG TPA: DUF2341 domain-containing protein [Kofleriaceae bacterium]|nr:DUF2341 domain-containing protein [Kofleriaceae bacterium]
MIDLRSSGVMLLAAFAAGCASSSAGQDVDAGASIADSGPPPPDAALPADAAIPGQPMVAVPNGGELWGFNSNQLIGWSSSGSLPTVNIELWKDGVKYRDIAFDAPGSQGSYMWTVPGDLPGTADYRIRVINDANPDLWDESNGDFGIGDRSLMVTTPNGAEVAGAGDDLEIGWVTTGVISTVDIELWRGGVKVRDVGIGVSNTGSYTWTVPQDVADASDYVIRVIDGALSSVRDDSDAVFSLRNWRFRAPITVTSAITRSNYPVLVSLPASFDYANAASDGSDLRFSVTTDHAAGFELDYYIETWVPGGISRVWVLMPALTAGGPDTFYLFYGQPTAGNRSSRDATFPVRFVSTGSDSISGTVNVDYFQVQSGHSLTLSQGAPVAVNARLIEIAGTIVGLGRGYSGGGSNAAGSGPGGGGAPSAAGGGGGGHGGTGGLGGHDGTDTPGAGGVANGSSSGESIDMGSGGSGAAVSGGAGGGAITLRGHTVRLTGLIDVDGAAGGTGSSTNGGGGAGGGVLIIAYDLFSGGTMRARGGIGGSGTNTANDGGGGGAGGRVKRLYQNTHQSNATVQVTGGAGGVYGDSAYGASGGAGTTFVGTTNVGEPTVTLGAVVAL